jgi:2-polyprenyl-6-methoxyphenol hydroxylase-like FAD-dependent oxidoreductase
VLGGGAAGAELAQAIHRFGSTVTVVEGAPQLLAREATPLGQVLGEALRADGIEVITGVQATRAGRDGADAVLELDDGRELRGDKLLVATGRRPPVANLGLETVGIEPDPHGIAVDTSLRAADNVWAIGDVTGVWPLTHVGEYEGTSSPPTTSVSRGRPTTRPCRGWSTRIPRPRPWGRRPTASSRCSATGYVSPAPTRSGPMPRKAAAGHAGHPGAHPARRAARHDPALPDLFGDPRLPTEGPQDRDRLRARHAAGVTAPSPRATRRATDAIARLEVAQDARKVCGHRFR